MRVIHLARKPLAESSVAANTIKHEAGGLNIDATRIGSEVRVNSPAGNKAGGESYNMSVLGMPKDAGVTVAKGRWPANVIVQHLPGCRCVGTRKVATGTDVQRHGGGQALFGVLADGKNTIGARADQGFAGEDGKEEIPAWDCEPGCPVADLDDAAGIRTSGALKTGAQVGKSVGSGIYGYFEGHALEYNVQGSSGAASRFYKQIGGES